ncbi:MAG: T9SS type A sorting domain-containing protein [Lentisphaeria bacterium]|nr:T9SS type A sorting domain-containing protein [Candidatus Neomarinimicrobiota bacterium]MCF7841947.1 T9SS type A sorting domain-containing protein [Lentisphaeria bacterium]
MYRHSYLSFLTAILVFATTAFGLQPVKPDAVPVNRTEILLPARMQVANPAGSMANQITTNREGLQAVLQHVDNQAEYYLGSGDAGDTLAVVFTPDAPARVKEVYVQWYDAGTIEAFAADYSAAAATLSSDGEVSAFDRGTLDISPIGAHRTSVTMNTIDGYTTDWSALLDIGGEFVVGDSTDINSRESFVIALVKSGATPHPLADGTDDQGNLTYTWTGGPWTGGMWGKYGASDIMMRVVVEYPWGGPITVSSLSALNNTFNTTGPFTVYAELQDDVEGTIAIDGSDNVALIGTANGDTLIYTSGTPTNVDAAGNGLYSFTFSGAYSPGTEIEYFIRTIDNTGIRSESMHRSFQIKAPQNPTADMLFIVDGQQSQMDLYQITANWNGIDYVYWNVQAEGGIDASVINYGWSNIVIYGWGNQTLPVVSGDPDPGYADFMDAGGNLVLIDQDWFYGHGLGPDLDFSSGDFAYDYFGLSGGTSDPELGGIGAADSSYLGISTTPMDTPFQTDPMILRHGDWGTLNWADYLVAGSGTPVFQGSIDGNHYGVVYENGVSRGAVFSFLADAAVEVQENGSVSFNQFWTFFSGVLEWLGYAPNGMSIHQARFEPLGEVVTVRGTVTTPNFDIPGSRSEYALQEGLDGIILYSNAFDAGLSVGDYVVVTGTLTEYRGKLELVPAGIEDIRVQGTSALPEFQTISIADLVADHNQYESELVRIENASIVDGAWPNPGSDANLQISDPSGAIVTMRVDKETDVDDNPAPANPFIVQGIVGDFDGPQILPRAYSDFQPFETGMITFQADLTTFIQNGWFDPSGEGDSIVVNGDFNGWNSTERMTPNIQNPNIYTMTIPNTGNPGDQWGWKFRLFPRTTWANDGWEIGDNRILDIQAGDMVLPPIEPACSYQPTELISQDVLVTFRVNLMDAINFNNSQPFNSLESVWLNGDFVTESGWAGWTENDTVNMVRLYDDGTNGDAVEGDHIWTAQVNFTSGSSAYHFYKYAAYDPAHQDTTILIDNESGFGDDHAVMIDDSAPTYDAGIDIWKTRNLDIRSIADVRQMPDGEVVTVSAIVTSPNFGDGYSEYTIQDESAGIVLFSNAFSADLQVGQEVIVTGQLLTYAGKSEIVPADPSAIQIVSSGNWIEPVPVMAADLTYEMGEMLESMLVQMSNVEIIEGAWPPAGSNANLTIYDGSGATTMRIDKETDIDDNAQPEGQFGLLGVISQFDNSEPFDAGYQIMPRFYSDFQQGGVAADVTFQADLTAFIENGWFDPQNPDHQIVVNGDFNGWNATEVMTPLDENPNVYTYTVAIVNNPGAEIRWKFRMSPAYLWQDSGWEIGANDAFTFTGEAMVLPLREPNCAYNAPLSQAVTVTFQVDMSGAQSFQTGQPFDNLQSVWMNGDFVSAFGWAGWTVDDTTNMIRLYDTGTNGDLVPQDGIWSAEVAFPEGSGSSHYYKYAAYDPDNMSLENPEPMDNEAGWGMNHHVDVDDTNPVFLPPVDIWASGIELTISIAEARAAELGSTVTVQGIITSPNFGTSGSMTEYTLQDESAGIVLFSSAFDAGLQPGDEVKVTGEIAEYNGKMEIIPAELTNVQFISSGNDLPPFQTLTIMALNTEWNAYESELVEILDVEIVEGVWPEPGNNMNLLITDATGETLTMRVDKETDVDDNPAPVQPFTLRGVVGDFNNPQVLPRFYSDLIQSDPELSHFELVYAGNPYLAMNFYVTSATIGGEMVSVGDEIGIFDGEHCVGAGVVTASITDYLALVAATDDPGTPEIDGFTPGNNISYRIWDASEGVEISSVSADYTLGDGTFASQGTAMIELTGSTSIDMNLTLASGWNIVSFYTLPDATDLQDIMQPLMDNGSLLKVQDESGAAMEELPVMGWINNIGEMNLTEGYYVKMANNAELTVSGAPVGLPFTVPLNGGWNIMGYPLSISQDALTAVQDLIDAGVLLKVQNESGAALEELPVLGWVNNIGNLLPGKGYYIKMSADADLVLNTAPALARSIPVKTVEPGRHFYLEDEGNPYLAMNVYVMTATLDEMPLGAGMEIGVFDGDRCVGSARLTETLVREDVYLPLIVGMDDPLTQVVEGFTAGNAITFRVWTGEKEQPLGATILTEQGSLAFEAQSSLVVDLSGVTIPDSYALYDCYPNPFNPSTTIRYDLPQDTRVALVIYDVLGREIRQLVVGHENAGEKTVIWDGRDNFGHTVPSGLYVYRLQAGDFSKVKKALFIK